MNNIWKYIERFFGVLINFPLRLPAPSLRGRAGGEAVGLFMLLLASCSTHLEPGEQLFTGLKPIDYQNHDNSEHFIETQAEVEAALVLDVPVIAQYHLGRWAFGLGPVFSFCISNDQYHYDYPTSKLNGKDKIKNFYLGLQPSIKYQIGRHFRIGIDGQIGLHDVRKSYGFETQTTNKYLHNIVATIGVVF